MRTFAIALALVLACAPEQVDFDGPAAAAPEPACRALRWSGSPERRSVVLVVSDTLRRDVLGFHGGAARTPAFDEFAREGLVFRRAYTEAPWTKPAVASLFTGLHPSQHGALSDPQTRRKGEGPLETDVLASELTTLAERMKAAGYRTAAIVANPWLRDEHGFAQGFDHYDELSHRFGIPGIAVSKAAVEWLRDRPEGAPYFLYVHYMDAHGPYGRLGRSDLRRNAERIEADRRPVPEEARTLLRRGIRFHDGTPLARRVPRLSITHVELAYQSGVEDFDAALEILLGEIDDDAAVWITSDHGEALFERGWGDHGKSLFDEELAIPMVARLPGVSADAPVDCLTSLVDVGATLCVYLGLDCVGPGAGVSLLPTAATRPARYAFSGAVLRSPGQRSIRNRRYKLVQTSPEHWSLYAVTEDPRERRDLLADGERSAEVEAVFEALRAELEQGLPAGRTPRARAPIDESTQRQLEALGYLGDAPAAER